MTVNKVTFSNKGSDVNKLTPPHTCVNTEVDILFNVREASRTHRTYHIYPDLQISIIETKRRKNKTRVYKRALQFSKSKYLLEKAQGNHQTH